MTPKPQPLSGAVRKNKAKIMLLLLLLLFAYHKLQDWFSLGDPSEVYRACDGCRKEVGVLLGLAGVLEDLMGVERVSFAAKPLQGKLLGTGPVRFPVFFGAWRMLLGAVVHLATESSELST